MRWCNGKRWLWQLVLMVVMGSGISAASAAPAVAPVPASAFFDRPAMEMAKLSPSGRHVAMLVAAEGKRNALAVMDLEQPGAIKVIARLSDFDFDAVYWVNEDTLIFDVVDRVVAGGERQDWPGLFSIGRDGENMRQLVHLRQRFVTDGRMLAQRVLTANHVLLRVPSGQGNEVVVGEYNFDAAREVRNVVPKLLDVTTGRTRSLAFGASFNAINWLFDDAGLPRAAVVAKKDRAKVMWREGDTDDWKQIADLPRLQMPWSPVEVDTKGNLYLIAHTGPAGEGVLSRFDFASGKPEAEPLVSTPGFDFRGGLLNETAGGRVLGVRTVTDAETTVWFDPGMKAIQAAVDQRLPGRVNRLNCRNCESASPTVMVRSWSDRDPIEYWVWQAPPAAHGKLGDLSKARLTKLASVHPGIDPSRMGTLDLHRIKARDGLELPVWVTTPPGAKPGQRLPTVVLVHGGPWVRGVSWQWEAQRQFLASRGYLVVEPEFRGSTGYGGRLFEAGIKQWGQAMQDDVADATRWAAASAGADPQRVCIIGASYGGYSTLMGLVRDPDLYRCGIAWAAVTEPRLRYEWSWSSDSTEMIRSYDLPALVGDPVADAAMLERASPLAQVARITKPLLLAFGEADRRVPLEHGTRLRKALREAGHDPQWVVYPGEGHGWSLAVNRIDFAQRMEKFLEENLR